MNKNILAGTLLCIAITSVANSMDASEQLQIAQQQHLQDQVITSGGPTFATVANSGADLNDCDFRVGPTVIQDAIDDPSNYDEIRVVVGTYPENLSIDDRDISIKGGYANCADAISDTMTLDNQNVLTVVEPAAPADNPVLTVFGDDGTRDTVSLTNLRFTGGVNNFLLISGGITTLSDNLQLYLTHMWIDDNQGLLGGGIGVAGGNTDVYARNIMVLGNSADQGGGIYCTGDETSVAIDYNDPVNDRFGIVGNVATNATDGNGGGVLATNGCSFSAYTGTTAASLSSPFDLRGIILNQAAVNGGGVAVMSGASAGLYGYQFCFFGCQGDNENPVLLIANTADSDGNNTGHGGGLFVADLDSTAFLSNGLVSSNSAYRGGGISVQDEAELNVDTAYTNFLTGSAFPCWSPGSCTRIEFNVAGNTAGGVRVGTAGVANINHSHILNNRSDFGVGFYVSGADSTLNLESSLLSANGDNGSGADYTDRYVVLVESAGTANIAFTTIADNNAVISTLRNSSSNLDIGSSIIHESNGLDVYSESTPNSVSFDCVMGNEIASIPGGFGNVADDPEFVDRINQDFHLNVATSPAIDYCDDAATFTTMNDIDNQSRGWDWPSTSNTIGPFDLGFDEQNDLIFANGFEVIL